MDAGADIDKLQLHCSDDDLFMARQNGHMNLRNGTFINSLKSIYHSSIDIKEDITPLCICV